MKVKLVNGNAIISSIFLLIFLYTTSSNHLNLTLFWLEISRNDMSLHINLLLMLRCACIAWKNFNHNKTIGHNLRKAFKIFVFRQPLFREFHPPPPRKEYMLVFIYKRTNRVTIVKNQAGNYSSQPFLGITILASPCFL